jgi:hypothetical protein
MDQDFPDGTIVRTTVDHVWYGYRIDGSKTDPMTIPKGTIFRVKNSISVPPLVPLHDIDRIPIGVYELYFESLVKK